MGPVLRFVFRYRWFIAAGLYLGNSWASNATAFLLRFEGRVPPPDWAAHLAMVPVLLVVRMCGFAAFGGFRGLWRYASLYDLRNIVAAVVSSSLVFYILVAWVFAQPDYPRSVYVIDSLVLIMLLGGQRLFRRAYHELRIRPRGKRVLLVGAGNAAELIVRDMLHNPDYDYQPIGFVDDDPAKQGVHIHGLPVLGMIEDLPRVVEKTRPDDVLIALPSAPSTVSRRVVVALQPFSVQISTLPNLREVVGGRLAIGQIRQLAIEDLLARPPVGLDSAPVRALIAGRSVLVTGAGGSIGSELCRQIASFEPKSLLLFDRYENTLFAVSNELRDRWPSLDVWPLVGDVCDPGRLACVFARHAPQIVFHAAAHKHVPLMESCPCEAIKNNVFGTLTLAEAASRCGVEKFIFISTDKAVNPTSVMGVSKRVAEMVIQSKNDRSGTVFAAVRFGNVLGSAGSVVPRFFDQIKAGGPVTVTHPDMRRFFMLIPEAVQLVAHAATLATGGEVFVLDMGEQVNVLEMAKSLIRLSGFVPYKQIPITFTGLRPGEKLYEELIGHAESVEPSGVDKITKLKRNGAVDAVYLHARLAELRRYVDDGNTEEVMRVLQILVPSYTPDQQLAGTCRETCLAPVCASEIAQADLRTRD